MSEIQSSTSGHIPFTLTVLVQDGQMTEAMFTDWLQQMVVPSLSNARITSAKTSVDGFENSESKLLTVTGDLVLSCTRSVEPLKPVSNTQRFRWNG